MSAPTLALKLDLRCASGSSTVTSARCVSPPAFSAFTRIRYVEPGFETRDLAGHDLGRAGVGGGRRRRWSPSWRPTARGARGRRPAVTYSTIDRRRAAVAVHRHGHLDATRRGRRHRRRPHGRRLVGDAAATVTASSDGARQQGRGERESESAGHPSTVVADEVCRRAVRVIPPGLIGLGPWSSARPRASRSTPRSSAPPPRPSSGWTSTAPWRRSSRTRRPRTSTRTPTRCSSTWRCRCGPSR